MLWEETHLVLILLGDTESERTRKPASALGGGNHTNPCNLVKGYWLWILVWFCWCLMSPTNIGKAQARLPWATKKSYSAILLHYSSASSSQAEKSTSNHQEKKNCPQCYSWDFNWRARLAWEPYQELGINVICGCVNFFLL